MEHNWWKYSLMMVKDQNLKVRGNLNKMYILFLNFSHLYDYYMSLKCPYYVGYDWIKVEYYILSYDFIKKKKRKIAVSGDQFGCLEMHAKHWNMVYLQFLCLRLCHIEIFWQRNWEFFTILAAFHTLFGITYFNLLDKHWWIHLPIYVSCLLWYLHIIRAMR